MESKYKFKVLFECFMNETYSRDISAECYYAEVIEVDKDTLCLILTDSYPLVCKICGAEPIPIKLLDEDLDIEVLFKKIKESK
ncbi:hypothetical protein DVH26_20010 [Paenibacillus sp. H1-7]|uniref:hypothetical protein n=1 Tax=Paenibacillus sp. H1-7 TaxID=2282849 RepID=UPI001EF7B014|nr:hypothetical protein [Paenibacillus sp. H1-7]ULL16524.1 hypothetical protein DVH26_20010 [Paenibacillus sp. H1-7]